MPQCWRWRWPRLAKGWPKEGFRLVPRFLMRAANCVGSGHNRRVQNGDPSLHGETDAFRNAGRQRSYRKSHHGHNACALLVLQRVDAAVWLWHGDGRREPQFSGRDRVAALAGSASVDLDSSRVRFVVCRLHPRRTPKYGTRISGKSNLAPSSFEGSGTFLLISTQAQKIYTQCHLNLAWTADGFVLTNPAQTEDQKRAL